MTQRYRYDAFISYSHKSDRSLAAGVQRAIQMLGKPWYRRRQLRVFRDDTSLSASPELWPEIERALESSRYLVILASPDSARSKWVNREIRRWFEDRGPVEGLASILIAVTAGEVDVDDTGIALETSHSSALAPAFHVHLKGAPLWIDLRPYRDFDRTTLARHTEFIHASAKLAARIQGIGLEDLLSEEVRQQRRSVRHASLAAAAILLLGVTTLFGAYGAEVNRRAAVDRERSALLAQSRFLAQAAVDRSSEGDHGSSLAVALEALPDFASARPRPYDLDSEAAAYAAASQLRERHVFAFDAAPVEAAFSDDGTWIIAAAGSRVLAWRHDTLQRVFELSTPGAPLEDAALSVDKSRIAMLADGVASVHDVGTGAAVAWLPAHPYAFAIAINADGTRVATLAAASVRLYDTNSGRLLQEMRGETPEYSLFQYEQIPADAVPHLAFNVAGDRLLALLTDLRPILLNAATGELITTLLTDATAVSLSAAFSVDGTAIVTADRGGISVWSARDGSFDVDDGGVHTGRNYLATGTQSRPQNDRCGDACHGGA